MTKQISFQHGVTLAGGAFFSRESLAKALALAPHPVAADGGADKLLELGVLPEFVIGDMDSLQVVLPDTVHTVPVEEQDTTDFGKCLARIDAPLCIGVGFLGERLDHTLAALSVLLEHTDKRVVLLGDEDVAFIAPPVWSVKIDLGTRVSFYPLNPCAGVSSKGLRWPIEGLSMAAGGQIGTSNEAIDQEISARFDPNSVVTILPKHYLGAVVDSLQ